jgi:sulfite reductase (NADPH) flavoprotein alpha-component
MLKQFWFQTHWLIGITAGIVLAVVGATGALLSFETDIVTWLNSDVRGVTPRESPPLAPPELLKRIQEANPAKKINALNVSNDPAVAARVTFANPRAGGERRQGPPGRGRRGEMHYVDPYTGSLIAGDGNKGEGFFQTTRSIHRWLTAGELGSRDIGKQIVGASTMLLVVLALSGLYLRWPRSVGNWRVWLTFDFALKGRSFLWHLHAILGTWVLVLYLAMALTGLYWSYDWYRDGLYTLTGTERPPERGREQRPAREGADLRSGSGAEGQAREFGSEAQRTARGSEGTGARRGMDVERGARKSVGGERGVQRAPDIGVAWAAFTQAAGEGSYSTANIDLSHGDRVEIRYLGAEPPHERAFNTIEIDSKSGAVLKSETYAGKRAGAKLMASIFPLHSGSFFGLPGIVLYIVASLAMPVFAITGWMLYLDRRKKKYVARATARDVITAKRGAAEDLLIGFASQAGFARQLAWQTAGSLQSAGVNVQVHSLAKLGSEQLARFRRALFVVSTFGEGEPPDEARGFARRIMCGSMPLQDMKFGLLALGDRQFRTFCAFGQSLEGWLRKQGAQPLFPRVEVDCGRPEALVEWQERLGELTGGRVLEPFAEAHFDRWRLVERKLINAGSAGGPMYHIELEPADPKLLSWEAGDIAEILVPAQSRYSMRDDGPATHDAAASTEVSGPLHASRAQGAGPVAATRSAMRAELHSELDVRREFSIASVPDDGRIHLVVRQVRKADGTLGAASGWLTELAPRDAFIKLRIRGNPLFQAPPFDAPLILVGNGTGIAGLRSHLKARELNGGQRAWLIFGERNERHDYLYRKEIEAWRDTGVLERVDLVFSRDQAERRYVQHVLSAHAASVKEYVRQKGAIIVCGSLEGMAPGVESALNEIFGEEGLMRLVSEGRYRRDVY